MKNAERRKKVRFSPERLTFVAVRPDFVKLGKLSNISKSGLCFHYMAQSGSQGDQIDSVASVEVDMFLSNNGYYLRGIPCRMIYDMEKKKETTFPIGIEYRRCGLKFGKLTKKQFDQLAVYITDHTEGAVQ